MWVATCASVFSSVTWQQGAGVGQWGKEPWDNGVRSLAKHFFIPGMQLMLLLSSFCICRTESLLAQCHGSAAQDDTGLSILQTSFSLSVFQSVTAFN